MILRPYQQTILEELRAEVRAGRDPVVVSPCGSGKGSLIAVIVKNSTAKGHHVIFAVHGKSLVVDMSERITKLGIDHGVLMGGYPRKHWLPVQVASIDTLHRMNYPPAASLIIADEADGAMSSVWRKTLGRYPSARLIGTTATPCRTDGRGLGKKSGGLFDSMVMGPTEQELIDMKYLVGSRVLAPPPPADLGTLKKTAGEFNAKQQASICDKAKIIGDIVSHWKKHAEGMKTASFGVDQAHAFHISEQFNAAGVPFAYVDAKTDPDERARIWRDLDEESGKLMGVSSCGITLVGWDHSIVSCLVIGRKTASLRLHKQILGRGSRTHKGKEFFQVHDHVGNVHQHAPWGLFEDTPHWSLDGAAIKDTGDKAPSVSTCKKSYRWPDGRHDPPKIINGLQLPCYATFKTGPRECVYCGLPLQVEKRDITVIDGELKEVSKTVTIAPHEREMREYFEQQKEISDRKGYKNGWLALSFRSKFNRWPPKGWMPSKVAAPVTEHREDYI